MVSIPMTEEVPVINTVIRKEREREYTAKEIERCKGEKDEMKILICMYREIEKEK